MKKQPDNTNPKIQKEKPNILIHRGKDDNNSKIVDRECLELKILSNQRTFKYDNRYKMKMIKSINNALGFNKKPNEAK